MYSLKIFLLVLFLENSLESKPCAFRLYTGSDTIACVCNSTYCDEFPHLPQLAQDQVAVYTTSQAGKRLDLATMNLSSTGSNDQNTVKILIDPSKTYQNIIGFGGAFTGAASYNLYTLKDQATQDYLIKSYFGREGNEYTLTRVPIAASDFSLSHYSYDDAVDDFNLVNFALQNEDLLYKIPMIQRAMNVSEREFKLFASPWSAPGWMKTNGKMEGGTSLKGNLSESGNQYWKAFANYHLKFFEAYHQHNIDFWGVTIQNEPNMQTWYPSMLINRNDQRDFIKTLYGPLIRSNNLTKNLKIMVWDSNRVSSRDFIDDVLGDSNTNKYVDGVGVHWYSGLGGDVLDNIHTDYPDKFLLYTEASASFIPDENHTNVGIGDWSAGHKYGRDILDDLNHWSSGWTDWNMVLNLTGGPRFNWTLNENRMYTAPIIVSSDGTEFYKQAAYYVLGHFSKFIVPNSTRIFMDLNQNIYGLQGVAFLTPANQLVAVFSNGANKPQSISVQNARDGKYINVNLDANSFTTMVWNPFASTCPSDWSPGKSHKSKCYRLVFNKQEPWFEANYDCSRLDATGTLISIVDAFENAEILKNAASSSCTQFYMGLQKGDQGWSWSNGDKSNYRAWKPGYSTNDDDQICGIFDKASGQWTNGDCDIPQCYICQMSLV